MRRILTIFSIFHVIILTAQNSNEYCKYISEELKEKPLECIDKTKVKPNNEIYQIFKWSAFRDNYLIRIEQINHKYILVQKKIYTQSYDQKTGEKIESKFKIIRQRKLTQKEYVKFMKLLSENHFWLNNNYKYPPICTDGGGIIIYALKKNKLLQMSNGNCAPQDEYLNNLYQKITELFNL
ncbi:hypothetical protein LF887_20575 [Chryseobacterium sp. MEBOG06]|uniref:hypothetical protein n=1 Tax=unclassified Chryseobacterium TaxID=2593645 RepID=UPI001F1B33A9|nr:MULTISPECIES: hypothetical protein [unclassified Chryseobacterium]UKB83382.1 hypothetical protein LF887_20575 [Chryseobacterium sp. MEBOG06]